MFLLKAMLVVPFILAQSPELKIVPHPGSENPVHPYQNVRLEIIGASLDDLRVNSAVLSPPRRGVSINEVATWEGEPYLLFEAQTNGSYWLALVTIINDKLCVADYTVEVGEGPEPEPDPDPEPEPDPDPTPPKPVSFSVVVGETAIWTNRHAAILTSQVLRQMFDETRFRVFDKDIETTPEGRAWIGRVPKDATLPYWFLADVEGRILYEGPLASSVSEAVSIVKKYQRTRE